MLIQAQFLSPGSGTLVPRTVRGALCWSAAVLGLFLTGVGPAVSAEWKVLADDEWCDQSWRGAYCEVRELFLPARDLIRVDAAKNGGIEIRGWDEDNIRILAKIQVHRDRRGDAKEVAEGIVVETDGVIEPEGPRHDSWGVSFRIYVPRQINLDLRAYNGGLSIEGVHGELEFETHNGGIRLVDAGGDVNGWTQNGGLRVELSGATWDGEGLNLETNNGGVSIRVPEDYSARLVTGTINGGLHVDRDFEIRRKGTKGRKRKRVRTTLGEGGPLIRVVTTNGGVELIAS